MSKAHTAWLILTIAIAFPRTPLQTISAQNSLPHEFVLLVHNDAGSSQVILSDTETHKTQVLWELPDVTQQTVGELISENELTMMQKVYDEDLISKELAKPFQQKITALDYLDTTHVLVKIEYWSCAIVNTTVCFGFFEYGNINPDTSDYQSWIKIDFHGQGRSGSVCVYQELLQSNVGYVDYANQRIAIQVVPSTKCLNLEDIYTLRIDYSDSTTPHVERINHTVGYSTNGNHVIDYSISDCQIETCWVSLQLGTLDAPDELDELMRHKFPLKLALGFDTSWDHQSALYAWPSDYGQEAFNFYRYQPDTRTSQIIAEGFTPWENLHVLGESMIGTKYGTLYVSPPFEAFSGVYKLESSGESIVFNSSSTCMTDLILLESDRTQVTLPLDEMHGCIDDWSLVK